MPVPNFNIPGLGIVNTALNAATTATLNAKPLALINAAKSSQPTNTQPEANDFDSIMKRVNQTMASKPTVSPKVQQEINREDQAARELSAVKIAKSKGEYINPEVKKFDSEKRFLGVRQDDGRIGIQDLQGKPKILTNQEVAQNASAIGDQTKRAIQMSKDIQARHREEDKKRFIERYGEEKYKAAQTAGSQFARQEAHKANVARLRATHGGANLSPEARQIQAIRQKDFQRWDRGEIGDVKSQGELGSDPNRFRNVQISSRTSSVQRQANYAAERAKRQMQINNKILNKENVENYKNILNEGIAQQGARAIHYLTGPGGVVPKIVDPVFDVVKWAARKLGIAGPKAGKGIRRANQATRAAVRVGVPTAVAAGIYKASGPAAEVIFPSPSSGSGIGNYGGYSDGGGGRRLNSRAGFGSIGRANARDRSHQKHLEFMDKVAASAGARDEREALIKTHMAQNGVDRKGAVAELEKDLNFNRLTSAGKKFQSGSSSTQLGTNREERKQAAAASDAYRKDYLEASAQEKKYGGKKAYAARLKQILEPQPQPATQQ